jgi:Spy/CpxP family protein refolding chaperone
MKPSTGARTRAFVLLALVATSGALAGVVGDRVLSDRAAVRAAAPPAPPGPRGEARYAERLVGQLELSPAQADAIDEIVAEEQVRVRELSEEVQPRFRAIADDTRDRIESVLTPEQRQRLRELRAERMRSMGERGRGAPRWLREGPGRDAPLRQPPMMEGTDSIMHERRLQWVRERDSILREARDSIMRERRNMPRERLDSIMRERRERMRERFEARDTTPGGSDAE